MNIELAFGLFLALAAVLLLARDLYRAWVDPLRRPMTLVVATLVVVLMVGTLGDRAHPSAWWLLLPAAVLAWEVARGWRRTPRCHLWEGGVAAFAVSLILAAAGLMLDPGSVATTLLAGATGASAGGLALLWWSRWREPRPWRSDDVDHYERRSIPRQQR